MSLEELEACPNLVNMKGFNFTVFLKVVRGVTEKRREALNLCDLM